LISKPSVDYAGCMTQQPSQCGVKWTQKKKARTIVNSYSQAPQGPRHKNTTMSAPLYVKGRFHHLTLWLWILRIRL